VSVPKVTSPSEKAQAAPRTGVAMAVIMTGVLMTAVDTTIVVLALPEIQRGLHVDLSAVVWVIISFLLVITLLATQVGRLGDMFGRVRMYETGFAVFVLGSLACALAWNEPSIIAFRVLQGIGGAFIMANSGAVIADLYPRELRGKAYGYTSVGWTMGAIIGIVLGGVIVTYISWRWIFWINVPVGVAALAVATRVLHDKAERSRPRLDLPGMITLGLGLFGVLWAMTRLANTAFDATVTGFLIGGLLLIGVFVLIERRVAEPMLPLSIFRVPTMAASLLASLFQGLASFAVLFLLIMYSGRHLDRVPVDLPRSGLRDLRRQYLAAWRGGRRLHLGPARRVLRVDGVHGARRRPVRAAGRILPGLTRLAQPGSRPVRPGHPLPHHVPGDVPGLSVGQPAVAVGGDRGDDGEDLPGQIRAAGRRVVVGRVVERLHAGQHRVIRRHVVGVELLQRAHGER
jgi:multidrug resistance protein